MLKLLKWNCIDFIRKYSWVLIGMLLSLLLAILPGNRKGFWDIASITLSGLIGLVVFQSAIYLAIITCYRWLEDRSNLLELSLPVPAWKILLGKLAMALIINSLACLFMLQLFVFIANYASGLLPLFSLDQLAGIPGIILILLIVDFTILFAYLVARSFHLTRRIAMLTTVLLSFVILGTLIVVAMVVAVNGMSTESSISSENILTINVSFNFLSTAISVIACLGLLGLEYAGCSLLLNWRFQPD